MQNTAQCIVICLTSNANTANCDGANNANLGHGKCDISAGFAIKQINLPKLVQFLGNTLKQWTTPVRLLTTWLPRQTEHSMTTPLHASTTVNGGHVNAERYCVICFRLHLRFQSWLKNHGLQRKMKEKKNRKRKGIYWMSIRRQTPPSKWQRMVLRQFWQEGDRL